MYYRKTKTVQVDSVYDADKTNEIICPVKVSKCDPREVEQIYSDEIKQTTSSFLENTWWRNKTNIPYKGIIKNNNDANVPYKTQDDLVVHKITSNDKFGLEDDYVKMAQFIEAQNDDLRQKFSQLDESTFKKEFEYVNKYKYQVKDVPKDYSAMKQLYAREQQQCTKNARQVDSVIYKMQNDDMPISNDPQLTQTKPRIKITRQ